MAKIILVFLLLLASAGCTSHPETCSDKDKACLLRLLKSHKVKSTEFWKKYVAKPFEDRVFLAPRELIEYIDLDNRRHDYPQKPSQAMASEAFIDDVKTALKELPDLVKQRLQSKFLGVYLLSNLGGTGLTDYVLDKDGEPIAAFVILDAGVLKNRKANEWATWKESTPFKDDSSYKIEAQIELKKHDNRKNAIQYILLHELGHVISLNENLHPHWTIDPLKINDTQKYAFFNESWTIDKDTHKYISHFDSTLFPERQRVVYYFGAQLKAYQMLSIYNSLGKTNFPTLYATVGPSDDWAESFVTYVHSVLMKKPFKIEIKRSGQVVKTYSHCWGTGRCKKKEAILSKFFMTTGPVHK